MKYFVFVAGFVPLYMVIRPIMRKLFNCRVK